MKLKLSAFGYSILLLLALNLNCSGEANGTDAQNGVVEKVTDVKIKTLQQNSFIDYIEVTGTVKADIATTLSAEEAGVLEFFSKDKGQWVNKDEVIAELSSKVLKANYDEAKAMYRLSEATFERQSNLYKDNVISEQKYLEYKYNRDQTLASYENLQARLGKTKIKSPISGYIDAKFVEIGEFVQPGMPVVSLVKTDIVKVSAGVPERFIGLVKHGSKGLVTFDVLPDLVFEGDISFVGPSINANSRTFPIEINLKNTDNTLKPEMFAKVKLEKNNVPNAVVIPRDAVIETETGKYVFLAENGVAIKRDITIGGAYEGDTWAKSGLEAGDRLIVVGHRELIDGERIAIHD